MKIFTLLLTLLSLLPLNSQAQNQDDREAIESRVMQYLQAWHQGDPDLMSSSIHPQMGKKIVFDTGDKHGALAYLSSRDLLAQTERKRPQATEYEELKNGITILDIYHHTATVKAEAPNWIDYLHMAKIDGEWKIVNILWELKVEGL